MQSRSEIITEIINYLTETLEDYDDNRRDEALLCLITKNDFSPVIEFLEKKLKVALEVIDSHPEIVAVQFTVPIITAEKIVAFARQHAEKLTIWIEALKKS